MYKRKRAYYNRNYGRRPSTLGLPYRRAFKRRRYHLARANAPVQGTISTQSRPYSSNLRGTSLLGTKQYVSLIYGTDVQFAAGNAYQFIANGLTDPDITGVGHQPRGFDQLMALYEHYTVLGSKITVTWATSGSGPVTLDVVPVSSGVPDIEEILESRMTQAWRIMPGVSGGAGEIPRDEMIGKWSAKKYFGVSDVIDDNVLKGSASSNPTEQAHYRIWNGTDLSLKIFVRVEYYCCFHEPKQPGQS